MVVDEDFKLYYARWWNSDLWKDISVDSINEAGEYFLNTYNVKLNISQIDDGWNSENDQRKIDFLLEEVEAETKWIGSKNGTDNHNSDILVAFTGQDSQLLSKLFGDYVGIAHPSSSSVINRIPPSDFSNLVQHEISHLFGAPDHNDSRFCIMDKTWPWPLGDGQIEGNIWTTHEWDYECFNIIESNKSEVSQYSEGGDYNINN
ncbi:MAG: hypothetical protein SCH39_02580 [Methanosarcinales archaeon]|nr:hypothetical protein [Methanosarcinales archaeon]